MKLDHFPKNKSIWNHLSHHLREYLKPPSTTPGKKHDKKPMKFHLIAGFFVLQAQQDEIFWKKPPNHLQKKQVTFRGVCQTKSIRSDMCFRTTKNPLWGFDFVYNHQDYINSTFLFCALPHSQPEKNLHLGACIHGFACRKIFVHRCIQHRFLEKKTVQKCPSDSWFADDFKIQVNERSWL